MASSAVGSKFYSYFPVGIRERIYCVYTVPPRPSKTSQQDFRQMWQRFHHAFPSTLFSSRYSGYGMDWANEGSGFDSEQSKTLLIFSRTSRQALQPIQPPIKWISEDNFLQIKR
jgi:hypothetical protein